MGIASLNTILRKAMLAHAGADFVLDGACPERGQSRTESAPTFVCPWNWTVFRAEVEIGAGAQKSTLSPALSRKRARGLPGMLGEFGTNL